MKNKIDFLVVAIRYEVCRIPTYVPTAVKQFQWCKKPTSNFFFILIVIFVPKNIK